MTPDTHHHNAEYPVLLDRLRAWASGSLHREAAVELLIDHGHWLGRDDFQDACIDVTDADDTGHERARICFDEAAVLVEAGPYGLPSSTTERQVLGIAASLTGWHPLGWSLDELLTGLDATNTNRVLDAVAHTTGHPNTHR